MFCSQCGAEAQEGARFCSNCGTALVGLETTGALSPVEVFDDTGPQPAVAGFAVLVVDRGANEGTAYQLHPPVVKIGRGADQEVFLDDVTVSRRHAELRAGANGWEIADLGSLNGTYVNRKPVQSAVLASGDEVQVGKYRFRFMSGGGGGA